jgi:ribosome maturation factor RimP
MKEQVLRLIGDSLKELDMYVYDVVYEKEGGNNYLRVVLDSETIIDMERVVAATKIINPLLDKEEIVKDNNYILDIYAKSKGDE